MKAVPSNGEMIEAVGGELPKVTFKLAEDERFWAFFTVSVQIKVFTPEPEYVCDGLGRVDVAASPKFQE